MSKREKIAKIKEIIRQLVVKELEEASTTVSAGGQTGTGIYYDTPYAFRGKRKKDKEKLKKITRAGGYKPVNESKELDTIEKIVKSTKNFMGVGKALKKVGIKSDFQTSMGLPRYTFKLNGKRYGILNKKNVSKPDRVVGDIAFGVMESVNEGKGVEKVLKMANNQSFGKLGGRTVDALSAGLFKGVYEKAPQNAKDKINKMNEKQLYVFMTKLWSKFGRQVKIS